MSENYGITRREVYEIVGKTARNTTSDYLRGFIIGMKTIFALPSAVVAALSMNNRLGNVSVKSEEEKDKRFTFWAGTLAGAGSFAFYLGFGCQEARELLFPLATNIVSGTYEAGRGIHKYRKNRLINSRECQRGDLSDRVNGENRSFFDGQ